MAVSHGRCKVTKIFRLAFLRDISCPTFCSSRLGRFKPPQPSALLLVSYSGNRRGRARSAWSASSSGMTRRVAFGNDLLRSYGRDLQHPFFKRLSSSPRELRYSRSKSEFNSKRLNRNPVGQPEFSCLLVECYRQTPRCELWKMSSAQEPR